LNTLFKSLLIASIATLLYILAIEFIASWTLVLDAIDFEFAYKYYGIIQASLQLVAVIIFIYFLKNRSFEHLLKRSSSIWYAIAVILGILFVFFQTPLNWIYNLIFASDYHILFKFDGLVNLKNPNVLAAVIFVAIAEELFFRTYIQDFLEQRVSELLSILTASFLFACIHAPYINLFVESAQNDWHLSFITFFGGLISSTLYYKSKSISVAITFHISWNIIALVA